MSTRRQRRGWRAAAILRWRSWRRRSAKAPTAERSAFLQEDVVGRIGRALEIAGLVARTLELAAMGVDALNRRNRREDAAAPVGRHFQFQPGNVARGGTRGVAGGLGGHGAAVGMLPVRSGIVTADRLALRQQGGDRFAKTPGELAVGAGLALVDLRALGVDAEHDSLAGGGDGVGKRVGGRSRSSEQQQAGDGKLDRHGRITAKAPKKNGPRLRRGPDDVRPRRAKFRPAYGSSYLRRF